jgi:hypothetical protein
MPGHLPSTQSTLRLTAVMTWLGVSLLIICPSLLFLWSFQEAQLQHRINGTYEPADARVISSIAAFRRDRGGRSFYPEITYEYEVNGTKYQSTNVTAIWISSGEAWANSVAARYRTGTSCKAFYNPEKPEQAILLREYSFTPYSSMLLMTPCLTFGVFAAAIAWTSRTRRPVRTGNGWFELFPVSSPRHRLKSATLSVVAYFGLISFVGKHFVEGVPGPHSEHTLHVLLGYIALGLVPLAFMGRYLFIVRSLGVPRLLLSRAIVVQGEEFKFTISQRAPRQVVLRSVRVRLLCIGTKSKGRTQQQTILHEEHPVTLKHHTLRAGEVMEFSGALIIQPDQHPTGRDASRRYNWIHWEIRLECKPEGSPDYDVRFWLMVEPATKASVLQP